MAKAEEMIEQAATSPEALDMVFGQMPAFTWSGDQVVKGIKVSKGATGPVISLGEEGRGRSLVEVPLVGVTPVTQTPQYGQPTEVIEMAAVVKLEEKTIPAKYSWEQPTVKTIYGLAESNKLEDAFLVRVSTGRGYTRRGNGSWELWKGSPVVLAKGSGADGAAGGIGSWLDGLFILREGDVVYVRPSGDGPAYALFVENGKVQSEPWISWKVKDAKRDPQFYVAKGTAPYGHVPDEWIGRVVTIKVMGERGMSGGSMIPTYTDAETGELISVNPLVLNLGWDGRDRHDVTVNFALWINLTDKQVRRIEGEALEKRQQIRAEADTLRNKAIEATKQSYFQLITDTYLRDQVRGLAQEQSFDTMPTEGWDSISSWVEQAKRTLEKLDEASEGLKALETQQNTGRILVNFEAWHRRGGATRNGDGWVIRADGIRRERDSDTVPRHKSDGTYHWNMVESDELALHWKGGLSVEVAKRPVNGLTEAQLATVKEIEKEIGAPEGLFGFNPEVTTRNAKRLAAIYQVLERRLGYLPTNGGYEGAPRYEFVEYEAGVNLGEPDQRFMRKVNQAKEPTANFDGRGSYLVEQIPAADGVIDFYVYHKYGHWNLGIIWRETGEEIAGAVTSEVENEEAISFRLIAGKDFRCSCGSVNSLAKGEKKQFDTGEEFKRSCIGCGKTGLFTK